MTIKNCSWCILLGLSLLSFPKNSIAIYWIFVLFFVIACRKIESLSLKGRSALVLLLLGVIIMLCPIDFCVRNRDQVGISFCEVIYQYNTRVPKAKKILQGAIENKDYVIYESYSRLNVPRYSIVLTLPLYIDNAEKLNPEYLNEVKKNMLHSRE